MNSERIEQQYRDEQELHQYLMEKGEVSFATYIDDVYKKVLLLSAASFFETEISNAVINFAKNTSKNDDRIAVIVEKKVISRQYHTLFSWDSKNTNVFWALFGDDTQKKVRNEIENKLELRQSELDFLDLGKRRNILVHENYSEHDVNITIDEIYNKYASACGFIDLVRMVLTPGYLKSE